MKFNTHLFYLGILSVVALAIQAAPVNTASRFKGESLFIQNDTAKPIIIRLNEITLSPLLPKKQKKLDPLYIKTLEFKYKGHPNLAFTKPNITHILNHIKTKREDAIVHVVPGTIYGLKLGKTEFITPPMTKEQAQETALKILRITKKDISTEPLSKEVAGKILNIEPSSTAAEAQMAFDRKFQIWHSHLASTYNQTITDFYISYLHKALKAFKPAIANR